MSTEPLDPAGGERGTGGSLRGFVWVLVAGIFVLLQWIPVDRSNPLVTASIQAPAEVEAILRTSCFDCHSNETRWPWYGRVAPVSWLVARDVREGREHLNFSEWEGLSRHQREDKMKEIWEAVEEGEMPRWFYLPIHPEARLSIEERATLYRWSQGDPLPPDR